MGIGSQLRSIGRKLDVVKLTKDKLFEPTVNFITGKDQENKQRAAVEEANRQAKIAAENASQPVKTEIDFEGTIKAARAAGINPLTALRSVGANTSTTQFHAPILSPMPAKSSYFERAINVGKTYFGFKDFQSQRATLATNTLLEQDYIRSNIALNMKNIGTTIRGRDDQPLFITAYDPTGKLADFYMPNPELFEMSFSEFTSSLGVIATSFASQNNITIEEAKDILKSMYENRQNNIELKQPKTKPVGDDWKNSSTTSAQGGDFQLLDFHERVRKNYERDNIPIPYIFDKVLPQIQ